MKPNPLYQRSPLRVGRKSFSFDPLLREELKESYRIWGVPILPDALEPNPKPPIKKGKK